MKKKIMVFALLLSFIFCTVPSYSVHADTDNVTWLYVAKKLPDDLKSKLTDNTYVFYRVPDNSPSNAGEYYLVMREWFFATAIIINSQKLIYFKNGDSLVTSCPLYKFDVESDEWVSSGSVTGAGVQNVDMQIIASNHDCSYEHETGTLLQSGIPTYEESLGYNFKNWCFDAGLNFSASSNESPSVIPYSYNSYWHIVRKSYNGKWLLTTIGNSVMAENHEDYTLMLSDDLGSFKVWNLYCLDDVNGYLLNVRQYVYDTDGWRLLSYNTYDSRDTEEYIIDLGAGSGVDQSKVIAYSNVNIYTETGLDLFYSASEEYSEPTVEQPTPPVEEPTETITPTPTGSAGDGSGGGGRPGTGQRPEVTDTNGLNFIVDLFSAIWSKVCSIPMNVDGYSITLQQVYIYGALVIIVGGFIIRFIFKR